MSLADELEKLEDMRRRGTISEADYHRAKEVLFEKEKASAAPPPPAPAGAPAAPAPETVQGTAASSSGSGTDEKQYCLFLHLSQFCGYVVPLAGLIVPIILWQTKKNESAYIDRNGRIVANWMISEIIYFLVCVPLCFVIIGFFLAGILGLLSIIFPIIGAIKANEGKLWPYPLSIQFFHVDEPMQEATP